MLMVSTMLGTTLMMIRLLLPHLSPVFRVDPIVRERLIPM